MQQRLPRSQGAASSARARKLLQLKIAQSLVGPRHSRACANKRRAPAAPRTEPVIPAHARTNAVPPRNRATVIPAPARTNAVLPRHRATVSPAPARTNAVPTRHRATVIPAPARTNAVPPRHRATVIPAHAGIHFHGDEMVPSKVKIDLCVRRDDGRDDGSRAVTFAGMTARARSRSQGRRLARGHVRRDDGSRAVTFAGMTARTPLRRDDE